MASNVIQAIQEYYSQDSASADYIVQNAIASYQQQEIFADELADSIFDTII